MSLTRCYDDDGRVYLVADESLQFSPAVFGIFINENDRILLLRQANTGLYIPPGLLVPEHETPGQAIRHYFRRLTGVSPILGALLLIQEQYRWLEGQGWRVAAMYYGVQRPFTASLHLNPEAVTGASPEWVELLTLQRSQFQFGFNAVSAGIAQLPRQFYRS
jgi:ADP-ribose pyrophosphatase YjhB (NUDIX family)